MAKSAEFTEFIEGVIWLVEYPVHYAGLDFTSRMSVIRMSDSRLMLHSPCKITTELQQAIAKLGVVTWIVAPGSYHYFHVQSAQVAFPDAETYLCPGIEKKRPDIEFDWMLGGRAPDCWKDEIDQVLVRGNRLIWEVAFLHKQSKTLLLVDLIENIGDQTPGTDWKIKFWWKCVFRMWNRPKPAPEYQLGWKDKVAAKKSLQKILNWDFEQIVISHGDNIAKDAKAIAKKAWAAPLGE